MKRYTPKELANELKIINKQEMRNMLRDYKELLKPQPSNHGSFRVQNGKDIDCGPYMTYGEDDLTNLKKIYMFKQLGMKRSGIIRLMAEEDKEVVIDKLIAMLEKKEMEIREQIIMAKHMKQLGTESVGSQLWIEGKTAHEYVEFLRDSMRDYESGMINMCLFDMMGERDEIRKELGRMDCLDYPAVKDYLAGNVFSAEILERGRFGEKIIRKLGKLVRLLQRDDASEKKNLIDKYVKSLTKDVSEGYGFIGKVSFGLMWQLLCMSFDEDGWFQIDDSLSEYFSGLNTEEKKNDIRIMFELTEWEVDIYEWLFDSLVNDEDELEFTDELLTHLCKYSVETFNLATEAEKSYFILLVKRMWKEIPRSLASDLEFEDELDEFKGITEDFNNTIIPKLQEIIQTI